MVSKTVFSESTKECFISWSMIISYSPTSPHETNIKYTNRTEETRNVGQCPTWWPPCRMLVTRSVQCRKHWLASTTRVPCSNAAKTRNPLKFAGCPKVANRSQPLVCRSSSYYQDMWRRYCCLTSFFSIVDTCLGSEVIARQSCAMVLKWRLFASCITSQPRAAHFTPAF